VKKNGLQWRTFFINTNIFKYQVTCCRQKRRIVWNLLLPLTTPICCQELPALGQPRLKWRLLVTPFQDSFNTRVGRQQILQFRVNASIKQIAPHIILHTKLLSKYICLILHKLYATNRGENNRILNLRNDLIEIWSTESIKLCLYFHRNAHTSVLFARSARARARVYVCFSARNIKCLPQTTLKNKKL